MATPVIDLRQRLREADLTEAQADAIAAGFEALDRKLDDVERHLSERIDDVERRLSERIDTVERRMDRIEAHLDRVEDRLRIHGWLLALILAAVLAPYIERLFAGAS